jgi:ABC-2 type transport system permease protein
MWAATTDWPINQVSAVMLGVWIVALATVAVWAYRRDEGHRFS